MPIIDKALDAAPPPVSREVQAAITRKARWAAAPSDWLSLALDQHRAIRQAFETCLAAESGPLRLGALKRLALVLNAHALAEELVLYPALARAGGKLQAGEAYVDQTAAKMKMAELECIDPSTGLWRDKLDQLRGAVLHHMLVEERGWFLDLRAKAEDQAYLTRRFQEEFERYRARGAGSPHAPAAEPRVFATTQATTGQLDRH
jgi:hypothetical protein